MFTARAISLAARCARPPSRLCFRKLSGAAAPATDSYIKNLPEGLKQAKTEFKKVLVIGAGGLSIGQAGEFDYSGSQALKALKEQNVESVLLNSNIAAWQTSHNLADTVYFHPVTPQYCEYIFQREKPDGILLTMAGQTGLNLGVQMEKLGLLSKYNVKVLGTSVKTLELSEDHDAFARACEEINIPVAQSTAVETVEEALAAAEKIGYPLIIRSAWSLGGLGSGFAANPEELRHMAAQSLSLSPQILVEKSLRGWKELEYEVIRDANDNCVTICNMENFDPLGVHTGDSIVIAPSQTLSDEEYHMLRSATIKIARHLGIVGEANVQFALSPDSLDYMVIESNARLSRSSALASKATGYPLAYTAAKIGLGASLPSLPNPVTKTTTANFEPSLDYVVVKVPRWDLSKFQLVSRSIGSQMKSVGEVMAIGRRFEESLQKAVRMVDAGNLGWYDPRRKTFQDLDDVLANPTDERWIAVREAMKQGYSVDKIHAISKIDKWFLYKLQNIQDMGQTLEQSGGLKSLTKDQIREAKSLGFSDRQIAMAIDIDGNSVTEGDVRKYRQALGIHPWVKRIDTLAAEFPADTNYLYTTYSATSHDVTFEPNKDTTIVLGSGVYRIGSSVEFDWGCTSAVEGLKKQGKNTICLNSNPETFSTDYDVADRLYFDELSYERIMDIYELEQADAAVVSFGGQLSQNVALKLQEEGKANVLGTNPQDIDKAEDRSQFSEILDSIGLKQPAWAQLSTLDEAKKFAASVQYPVLVRPSYVLSGAAMSVIRSEEELEEKLQAASDVSQDHPVVISKFMENAAEIDVDAVAHNGQVLVHAISEHVEPAGIHSGDATLILPPQSLGKDVLESVKTITQRVAKAWNISGPFNMQLIKADTADGYDLLIIETNLRASRSFPFVSKALGTNFVDIATRAISGLNVPEPVDLMAMQRDYVAVKVPQFSWTRLAGADPMLGVEMSSTGEVAAFGHNLIDAYWSAIQSVNNFRVPEPGEGILLGGEVNQDWLITIVKNLEPLKYKFFCASPDVKALVESSTSTDVELIDLPTNKLGIRDTYQKNNIKAIFNLCTSRPKDTLDKNYLMRRNAVDFGVPLFMEANTAILFSECLAKKLPRSEGIPPEVLPWSEFIGGKPSNL